MTVPGWALALMIAGWLAWGALCWTQGYNAAMGRRRSPRTKSDE